MGFVKKALKVFSPIAAIAGGGSDKKAPTPAAQAAEATQPQKTESELAADQEKAKKAALIAGNAGSGTPKPTVGGGNPDVTRKVLLGL